jgi:hypothetical protein
MLCFCFTLNLQQKNLELTHKQFSKVIMEN